MTDEKYVKRLAQIYEQVMSYRKDENYAVNQPQMDKLMEVLDFFNDIADKCDGEIVPIELVPREEHGWIMVKFVVFDIYGEEIQRFCDVMRCASAIGVDCETNGKVCISVTVPNVFVPINE